MEIDNRSYEVKLENSIKQLLELNVLRNKPWE